MTRIARTILAALAAALLGVALMAAPSDAGSSHQTKCDTNPPRGDLTQCVSLVFDGQADGTGFVVKPCTLGCLLAWSEGDNSELDDNPAWNATVTLRKGNGTAIASTFLVGTQGGSYMRQSAAFDGAKFGADAYITVDYKWFINFGEDKYGKVTMYLP